MTDTYISVTSFKISFAHIYFEIMYRTFKTLLENFLQQLHSQIPWSTLKLIVP